MRTFKVPRVHRRAGLLSALWLTFFGLAAHAPWWTVSAQPGAPAPAGLSTSGAPVAARTPYTVVLQESTRRHGEVLTMALRGDGAFLVQFEHLVGPTLQRTFELPTGVTVVVDDIRERRTSRWTRSGTSFRARMDPARGCIRNDIGELVFRGHILAERDVIAGYDTVKVASGDSTFWFAPQVGCANVKSRTRSPGGGLNEKVATLISPGEPDSALFSVPDRYEEVPPSVFHQMDPDSAEAREMDRSYFQRRPPQ